MAVGIAVGILMAGTGAAGSQTGGGNLIRWDLAQVVQDTALCCGTDVARAENGDTLTLTGSGQASTGPHPSAFGGGTFVHRTHSGHEIRGIYVVTGFVSWTDGGGTLPFADGIGRQSDARAGLLTMNVQVQPEGGGTLSAVLTVQCVIPGNTLPAGTEEGVVVQVGSETFEPAGGLTLFHILA